MGRTMQRSLPNSALPSRRPPDFLLFRPLGLAALLLLVANDAYFKLWAGAGAWAPVTGKLSDVAGAIVLPALLEVMLAYTVVRSRTLAAWTAVAVSATALILLETSHAFVAVYVRASQAVFDTLRLSWRAGATMDLTDLAVLPLLALCLVAYRPLSLRSDAALGSSSSVSVSVRGAS